MDLKEYLKIFRKNFKIFAITVVVFILAGSAFQLFKEKNFKTSLNLNITRIGKQQTENYKYDDFYRLQADERFADTVVRWLGSPRIAADIYREAGISADNLSQRELSGIFNAKRLSSQMIEVNFTSNNQKAAEKISEAIIKITNRETENLNKDQKEEAWFTILGSEPIIKINTYKNSFVFAISLLVGIFVGIWTVYIKHYFSN
jgi:capsular polysaccharide biosynthesis protein